MSFTVAQIADALDARFEGDGNLLLDRPSEPSSAQSNHLALAMESSYGPALTEGHAQAAVLWNGADWQKLGLKAALFVERPRFAMAHVTGLFSIPPNTPTGIHPILSHVTIAEHSRIGANALISAGVRIGARTQIGNNLIAHANGVIGADGFSFVTPKPGAIDEVKGAGRVTDAHDSQEFTRIHSIGAVRIGDNVELGAGVAIDRGTIADTVIGDGTKLDNLVQIGHNVQIGKTCLLCGQVGIGGSTIVKDRVVLGGHQTAQSWVIRRS